MSVVSPVSERLTVVSLLLLTFATGIVDAVSVLALGHVFVANMTGNIIFLGFWFVPHSGIDLTAAIVAFVSFVAGTVLGSDSRLAGGTGHREKLRYSVVVTMCAGAVVGATITRFTVAPAIALAGAVVAVAAAIFRFGPHRQDPAAD